MGLASKLSAISATQQQSGQQTSSYNSFANAPIQSLPSAPAPSAPSAPSAPPPPLTPPFPSTPPTTPIFQTTDTPINTQQYLPQVVPQIPITAQPGLLSGLFKTKPKTVFTTPGPYYQPVKNRLDATISNKNLHAFYPPNSPQYNNVLIRLSNVDFASIATKRSIPMELAFDLASLGLFDIVILVDDSGSMNFDENWKPSKEKKEDLDLILARIADIGGQFDDDGISIRYINSDRPFDHVICDKDAMDTVKRVKFSGGTPLGKSLYQKVLKPMVYDVVQKNTFAKPVMVYVITDGSPDNKDEVRQNILQCKQWLASTHFGKSAVSFMFCQVGRDPGAAFYLSNDLDKDPEIGEDVDTTGNYEQECEKYAKKGVDLTPDLWLLQMMLGGVDPTYDEGND